MITAADIRAARARVGETQAQFGRRFGVSRWAISAWERHKLPPEGPALVLIGRILNEIEGHHVDGRAGGGTQAAGSSG